MEFVQSLLERVERRLGAGQHPALLEEPQPLPLPLQPASGHLQEPSPYVREMRQKFSSIGHHQFGGGRRGGGTKVGHEVGNGEVPLVSDGGDDGLLGGEYGPSHLLVVEGPKFLDGASPSGDDYDLHPLDAVGDFDGPNDGGRGLLALHQRGHHHDVGGRKPSSDDGNQVPHRRTHGRGDQRNLLGIPRERPLPRLVEKPLRLQLPLQLLELQPQNSRPQGQEGGDVKLVTAPLLEDGDVSSGQNLHPITRLESQLRRPLPPHHAVNHRLLVLEREVEVSRSVALIVGNFSPHPNVLKQWVALQEVFDVAGEFGDGED